MAELPPRFRATASWWKLFLVLTLIITVTGAAGAGRRIGGDAWMWMLPVGPVLAVPATWTLLRTRRGDRAAGLDPVVAATARDELIHGRVPEDPAVRAAARQVLPGLARQLRMSSRRVIQPICVLAAVGCAVTAGITRESVYLACSAVAVVTSVIAIVTVGRYTRRYERMRQELDQDGTVS